MRYRSNRLFAVVVSLLVGISVVGAPAGAFAESDRSGTADESWWTSTYLVDYGLTAAGTTGYIVGERLEPRTEALFGPAYDPDEPAAIFDSDKVGRTYLEEGTEETFPTSWLQATMFVVGVGIAGLEMGRWARGSGSGSAHYLHEAAVGYAETTAVTASIVSLSKPFFGRLRPDFADRARRYHCSEEPERFGDRCDGYRDRPLAADSAEARELLEDGRRSFISGHATHSFNMFTFTSLLVGGHFVWGDRATTNRRIGGIGAQTAMMGAAAFITASRLSDGRHHVSDVVAGSLIGIATANASYWRRFDSAGNLRRGAESTESVQTRLQPFGGGVGLSVTRAF